MTKRLAAILVITLGLPTAVAAQEASVSPYRRHTLSRHQPIGHGVCRRSEDRDEPSAQSHSFGG